MKVILLEHGANPNIIGGGFHHTPLIKACFWGPDSCAILLIEAGANLDVQDDDGKTALMYAVQKIHLEAIKYLIEYGADITLKSKEGLTAFEYTTKHSREEFEEIFRKALQNRKARGNGTD